MKRYILLSATALLALCTQAQTKWTLRQCIDYAVENNIEIKQQELAVKNSEISVSTSKNSRLPDLSANIGQQFSFGQIVDTKTNTNMTTNASSASLSVSSSTPLFTGFRITNDIKVKELDLKAAIETLNKAKDNMQLSVASYFLEALFQKEILKAYEEQATLTRLQTERTEKLVEGGKAPQSQLYDIKAQLAKDELNIVNANNSLSQALLNLAQVLNIKSSENFDIEAPKLKDVITENISSIVPVEQIYQASLGVKPHVKEAEYNLESSRKSLKVAQSGYYPTLNFNMRYGTSLQRSYGRDNTSFNRQFNDNAQQYFEFSLNIPIFSRFETRNQVRSARLSILNRQLALDNVKLELYKEIQQAYRNALAAQAKYTSTEKAQEAANESYKYAQERYAVGKSTVFELNEAQTKVLSSKSEQIQAKYDFLFRAKILDFYQGRDIDIK